MDHVRPAEERAGPVHPLREIRRLVLWDVDGTLVSAGPAAREAFDLAVASVLQREIVQHDVQMSGKTDPQIALEILAAMAVSDDEAASHLPAVLQALEEELEGAVDLIREKGFVHAGVEAVLRELYRNEGVLQSVLTGNVEANGRLKVSSFGLDEYLDLDVGAHGSDDADRTRLVPVALAKLRAKYGVELPPRDVWVVGDTPRDLECARAGGARCLLVGTGRYAFERLEPLGADAAVPSLADTAAIVSLLVGDAGTSSGRG